MITLTITAETPEDFHRQLSAIHGNSQGQIAGMPQNEYAKRAEALAPLAEAPQSDEPKRRGRPPKEQLSQPAADTSTGPQAQTEAGAADAAPEASDDAPIAYETHIKPAILRVSTDLGGREAVLKLLSDFEVDHASKLTEAQWPALLARVAAMEAA